MCEMSCYMTAAALALVAFGGVAAQVVGSMGSIVQPLDNHKHLNGCVLPKGDELMAFNESRSLPDVCHLVTCHENRQISYTRCIAEVLPDNCTLTEFNLTLPYPACCPIMICNNDTNHNDTSTNTPSTELTTITTNKPLEITATVTTKPENITVGSFTKPLQEPNTILSPVNKLTSTTKKPVNATKSSTANLSTVISKITNRSAKLTDSIPVSKEKLADENFTISNTTSVNDSTSSIASAILNLVKNETEDIVKKNEGKNDLKVIGVETTTTESRDEDSNKDMEKSDEVEEIISENVKKIEELKDKDKLESEMIIINFYRKG